MLHCKETPTCAYIVFIALIREFTQYSLPVALVFLQVSQPQHLKSHGVTTVFVEAGNTKFELLLPLGEKSPIESYLDKNKGGGMHHICLEVDNIQAAIEDLRKKNIRTLSKEPSIGAHGKPVMFLHPKDCGGVLVELEQV